MKLLLTGILLLTSLVSFSQAREIYVNPKFDEITQDHKKIAILPFKTIIQLRPKQMEKMSGEQFNQLQRDEGLAVQSAIQTYFLKRKEQHNFNLDILDLNTTNALLAKQDIDQSNLDKYTPQELGEILHVDGIITGMLVSDKPMSEGAALAIGLLVGFYGPTNSGKCTINLNDATEGELLWKYEKTLSRGLGSDINTIINTMMRQASRRLPYITD